ncbi:MAG: hypothetical protein JWQ88_1440, partial [Rhodoferax sp.]|nr:hypothetical protein [Rhodoferax sp.]
WPCLPADGAVSLANPSVRRTATAPKLFAETKHRVEGAQQHRRTTSATRQGIGPTLKASPRPRLPARPRSNLVKPAAALRPGTPATHASHRARPAASKVVCAPGVPIATAPLVTVHTAQSRVPAAQDLSFLQTLDGGTIEYLEVGVDMAGTGANQAGGDMQSASVPGNGLDAGGDVPSSVTWPSFTLPSGVDRPSFAAGPARPIESEAGAPSPVWQGDPAPSNLAIVPADEIQYPLPSPVDDMTVSPGDLFSPFEDAPSNADWPATGSPDPGHQTPEPAGLVLLLTGLLAMRVARTKRARQQR